MSRAVQIALLMVGLIVAPAFSAQLHTFVVDQHNDDSFSTVYYGVPIASPLGQSFVPSSTGLDAVELVIFGTCPIGQTANVTVQIRSGSITGEIVGTSSTVPVPCVAFHYIAHFDFPVPITLDPGATCVIEVVAAPLNPGDSVGVMFHNTNPYAAGSAILQGIADPARDFWFREGAAVATPTAQTTWGQIKALYR